MVYEFKLDHNILEASKSICCVQGESTVDHSTVTRWFKKFRSDCKNLNDQARSGEPKRMDFQAVLQAIESNPASNLSCLSVVHHFHNLVSYITKLL